MSNSETARHSAMGGRENAKGVDARLQRAASLETASSNAWRESQSLQQQAQAVASGQASLGIDLAKASPQLAQQISSIAQTPEFQRAINSGNVKGATEILAQGLSANMADGKVDMAQILNAVAPKPDQAPGVASGPGGGAAATQEGLKAQYAADAAKTASQGDAAVDQRWGGRPQVAVGGPKTSGVVGAVQSGQAGVKAAASAAGAAVVAGRAELGGEVQPKLPGMQGRGMTQPNSQMLDVSQSLGNDAANTAQGVIGFGAQAGRELLQSSAVQGAVGTVQAGSEAALKGAANTPRAVGEAVTSVKGGPTITFPYNGNTTDPMAHVNKLRAEKGLPPLPSSVDQIPR